MWSFVRRLLLRRRLWDLWDLDDLQVSEVRPAAVLRPMLPGRAGAGLRGGPSD
jgi:hypothetical protein